MKGDRMAESYFPTLVTNPGYVAKGYELDLRAEFAWELLNHFGVVAGKPGAEDTAGRSICDLQAPAELVERACQIAEQTVSAFEARGWIRRTTVTAEGAAKESGRLRSIALAAEYATERNLIDHEKQAEAKREKVAEG
jgi:hypothetical protein